MHVHEYRTSTVPPEAPAPPLGAAPPGASPLGEPRAVAAKPQSPQPRSRLGELVLSLAVLAVGVIGVIDLAGASVAASVYIAAMLTVVGLGLLAGAWYGRARWLIPVGVVLMVTLGIVAAAEAISEVNGPTTWRPMTFGSLQATYRIGMGSAVLDMSALDFAGRSEAVDVSVDVGELTIIVPPDVDVRAQATVDVGSATVFGTRWTGIGQSTRRVTNDGADGPGGGDLVIRATVDVGDLEVRR